MNNNDWIDSDWYRKWLELAHQAQKQENVGYWYWDNINKHWKFQKPQ